MTPALIQTEPSLAEPWQRQPDINTTGSCFVPEQIHRKNYYNCGSLLILQDLPVLKVPSKCR